MILNPLKPKPIQSLLGLALYGRRLTAAVSRRNGELRIGPRASITLSRDTLTNDPELVAQEIRSFLDQHEIRESRCLICLPSNLAMAASVDIPDLSDDDLQSYLEIQAEAEFPFALEDLNLASVAYTTSGPSRHAMLAAVPKTYVIRIQQILQHAGLRPLSLTLSLPESCHRDTQSSTPHLLLDVQQDHVGLSVRCGNGFSVIRSLDEVFEPGENYPSLDCDVLTREIKITLGQLPNQLRKNLSTATICHQPHLSGDVMKPLEGELKQLGFRTELRSGDHTALDAAVTNFLRDQKSTLEFLPPKKTQLQIFAERVSSRRNAWISASVGSLTVLTAAIFYFQGYQLKSLEREWNGMADKVTELETLQNKIRQFRPWYDNSAQSLQIAKQLAAAFPKEGSIWAKSFEIKENNTVFCSGSARNYQDLIAVTDRLRAIEDISDVTLQQSHGEAPVQFAFKFVWNPGGRR
ncbi:MAG: hypothetical protein M2R45_00037 [Verrucomicrobia subdivision 3 bacterium]|nr:hypothetical protein [Limisphaerales bacterium]MCS1412504.1 hypothetical protein [Limisphaerales bacterium]